MAEVAIILSSIGLGLKIVDYILSVVKQTSYKTKKKMLVLYEPLVILLVLLNGHVNKIWDHIKQVQFDNLAFVFGVKKIIGECAMICSARFRTKTNLSLQGDRSTFSVNSIKRARVKMLSQLSELSKATPESVKFLSDNEVITADGNDFCTPSDVKGITTALGRLLRVSDELLLELLQELIEGGAIEEGQHLTRVTTMMDLEDVNVRVQDLKTVLEVYENLQAKVQKDVLSKRNPTERDLEEFREASAKASLEAFHKVFPEGMRNRFVSKTKEKIELTADALFRDFMSKVKA